MVCNADGLLCLVQDGWVTGANTIARQLASELDGTDRAAFHVSELFGITAITLFDAVQ